MNKPLNPYTHLLISALSIPALIYGPVPLKLVFVLYGIWLVLKRDAAALPALIVLVSYMSNSYAIYFAIIGLGLIYIKQIYKFSVFYLFIILVAVLPYVAYLLQYHIFQKHEVAGLAINQFQLYFSLFAFFYGLLITDTINKKVIVASVFSLLICFVINFLYGHVAGIPYVRNIFYTLPFFGTLVALIIFGFRFFKYKAYLVTGIVVLALGVLTIDATFTVILSVLLCASIAVLCVYGRTLLLKFITGIPVFLIFGTLVALAVADYDGVDYSEYRDMKMSDVRTTEQFVNRFKMKLYEDRAPIWNGVYESIVKEKDWLIPVDVKEIEIITKSDSVLDFEFHSHNLFLEFVRLNGILFGVLFSLIFVVLVVFSNRVLWGPAKLPPLLLVFIATSLGTTIIGAFTGIYVLLPNFAMLNMTFLGVAFASQGRVALFDQKF